MARANDRCYGRLCCLLVISCAVLLPVQAATEYDYSGNLFNQFFNGGTCPPECRVTGSFSVAQPLAPNLPELTAITPLSFSISSGGFTLTNATVDPANSSLSVGTNAAGQITTWSWLAFGPLGAPTETRILTQNVSDPSFVYDDIHIGNQGPPSAGPILAIIDAGAGTWTGTVVPEPGTALIAAISLAVFAFVLRRHGRLTLSAGRSSCPF